MRSQRSRRGGGGWGLSSGRGGRRGAERMVGEPPPFVTPVGVFMNQPLEEVLRLAARCSLQTVQLHGDEPDEYSRRIPLRVIKAVRVRDAESLRMLPTYPAHAF